jgi:hypothetical protein
VLYRGDVEALLGLPRVLLSKDVVWIALGRRTSSAQLIELKVHSSCLETVILIEAIAQFWGRATEVGGGLLYH